MAKVLVAGGAGYVGSAVVAYLLDHGHEVTILDNLTTGHSELILSEDWVVGDIGDRAVVGRLLETRRFDCAMHFAARSLVSESVRMPEVYRENNVIRTGIFFDLLVEAGVKCMIFSSTCAIFGDPGAKRISEDTPKQPITPYGQNKLEVEQMMKRLSHDRGVRAIALRYFNAAGAEPKIRVGEWHEPETHLIPSVIRAALDDREVFVMGTDYATRDGTCIRDYIHVWDLAHAHVRAMEKILAEGDGSGFFKGINLGSERGFSVREVIDEVARVIGKPLKVTETARRPGDPPHLVADSTLAREYLGFSPRKSLGEMIESAYQWELKRRKFGEV